MSGSLAQGFLDDIVANIDDDTPRLVYADWLSEQGKDDRAEFIRVQVERARLPEWDAAQVSLALREEELLRLHGEEWLAELPAIEGAKWEGFRRGIVAEVSFASYEALRKSAHACRAVAPVEAVTVRWPRQREAAGEGPPIAELRELSLTGRPGSLGMVARLANSPQLATIRTLTARGLWPPALARLAGSSHLAWLKGLCLPSNTLGGDGILALVNASALSHLEELDLSGMSVAEVYNDDAAVGMDEVEALARWDGLRTVRSLNLSGNDLGGAALRSLLHTPYALGLKDLSLRNSRLNHEALEEFASSQPLLRLETLDLGENVLGDRGVKHLAAAPCLSELKGLWLDRCEIPARGAPVLTKAPFFDGLRFLDVAHNHFGPVGLGALVRRQPPALHTLGLRDNDLGDDLIDKGLGLLASSLASDVLLKLDLSRNGLGDAAAQALAESPHLRQLLVLRLLNNRLSASAAAALAASPLGQRLAVLELENILPRAG